MGSLMAGWDSPVPDPKREKLRRNSSLTREEIDSFWRNKKEKEQEHLTHISLLSPRSREHAFEDSEKGHEGPSSSPLPDTNVVLDVVTDNPTMQKLTQKNDWWMASNWAFLNEPPVIKGEGPQYRYASQVHVATMATPDTPTGVGA